jgi:ADP-ribose pyrophosphatase YjhB (NUDIX family)
MKTFQDANYNIIEHDGITPIGWRISAYGVIVVGNKILLVKQGNVEKYQFPGGGIEINELISEGLKRELVEEIGLDLKLHLEIPFHIREGWFHKRSDKSYYHSLMLFYRVDVELTDLENLQPPKDSEINEIKLISIEELSPKNVQEAHWNAINKLGLF